MYRQKSMASTTRTTAMALDALVRVEPEHPLVAKAARWLLGQRQGKSWGTTQETTYALLVLTDYLLATGNGPRTMSMKSWSTVLHYSVAPLIR